MPGPLRQVAVWIALGLLVTACAPDITTLQKRLEPHDRALRPQGSGPFPAVLLVPGCGGISPARVRTAEQLVGRGFAVAFVDYLASRGLRTACRGEVSLDEVVQDIRAVSAHLRTRPDIASTRLGIVGWSFGGAGTLASLADQEPPFRAVAAFYPPCAGVGAWKARVPVLLLLGGQDDIAPPGPCQDLVRSVGPGRSVDVRLYPEARHSFDVSDLPAMAPSRAFPGKTTGHHPEAAREAWNDIFALFDRELRR